MGELEETTRAGSRDGKEEVRSVEVLEKKVASGRSGKNWRGVQEAGQLAGGGVGATEGGEMSWGWRRHREGILGGKYEMEVGSQKYGCSQG